MSAYGNFALQMTQAWFTGTFKAMVMGPAYTQDVDAHQSLADLQALNQEAAFAGYPAGGTTLTGLTVTYDPDADAAIVGCDDLTLGTPATDLAVGAVVFYRATGDPTTSVLVGCDDAGATVPAGATFTYQVDPDFGFASVVVSTE